MRKLLFGLFTLAALGFGALTAQPAQAQPYYPGYAPAYRPVVVYPPRPAYVPVQYRRPRDYYGRPAYRPYRPYRYARPVPAYRPVYRGPRCVVRPQRVWTAYGWVNRPVRVCR